MKLEHKNTLSNIFFVAAQLETVDLAGFLADFQNIDFGKFDRDMAQRNPKFVHAVTMALGEAQGKIRNAYALLGPGYLVRDAATARRNQ